MGYLFIKIGKYSDWSSCMASTVSLLFSLWPLIASF